jgi:ArsR family transcriptional regulator
MCPSIDGANNEKDKDLDQVFAQIKAADFTREADIFKALGHPIRMKIIYGLLKVGGCNVKNMQECLGLHQATVSQHLIHLKSRGLIESTRHGLEMVYKVTNPLASALINTVEKTPDSESPEPDED